MENYKCAFSGALIGKQYGCQYALEVTRREGPSIACTSANLHEQCALLMVELKAAAIPHFGFEDDLTQMPHSVIMKIQSGGLAALRSFMTLWGGCGARWARVYYIVFMHPWRHVRSGRVSRNTV